MNKKILCLIDSLGPGGAQRQLVGLAVFLKEQGYDVTVACYDENRFYVDMLLSHDVPYVYLEKANKSTLRIWHIARYIRKVKPGVVIAYLETPSICACLARVFNRSFKLIVSERNTTQRTGNNERIRFNLFRLADYIVPNAYSQSDYIKQTFPFLSEKVVTIPNFVDLDYFAPLSNHKRRNVPEIMVAASIWESKNTLGFIDAVAALRDKGYKFHISWYGLNKTWVDYIQQCNQKIEEFQLQEFIELKAKTNKIRDLYQDADYFCLPSFYEGTPNVICEAMACGLPVICSEVCDNFRYVIDNKNGFLFDPKDINSMTKAFDKLFSLNEEDYLNYCYQSRLLAEQKFNKEVFVKSYIKLLA